MVFSWFSTRAVDAFVDAEVADLVKRVPPGKLNASGATGRKAEEQLAKSHDSILRHAQALVQREKPNFYQKARLANRLKWALREARYPAKFVDELAFAMAAVAASANAQREI
jgi:hypothetical protein